MIVILFLLFFVLIVLGVPLAACMALPSMLPYAIDPTFTANYSFIIRSLVTSLDSTSLLAVPLFMLSGAIMAKGGISKKLFDVFALALIRVPAGMPIAVIVTCLFFGSISGSGVATVAAVGAMCIPVLTKLGYDKVFCAALVATAGGLGIIIPPSMPFILYGVICDVSVGALFKAGIIPGIMVAFSLMLYSFIYCMRKGEDKEKIKEKHDELKARGAFNVIKDAFWALMTPVVILGGIYSGIVTPTEAACLSIFYALLISIFFYKTMEVSEIWGFMVGAVMSYAPIMMLIGFGQGFGKVLSLLHTSQIVSEYITSSISNGAIFLLLVNIFFLLLGMVGETNIGLVILGPVLVATAISYGISPIHFGVIIITNLAIGMVSPPIGVSIFVAAPMIDVPPMRVAKEAMPFMLFFLIALFIITYVPQLSLMFETAL